MNLHPELETLLDSLSAQGISRDEKRKAGNNYLLGFFGCGTDGSGTSYCMKHVTAPRGSLILWDSRTVHWNQHPRKDRPHSDSPKVRMVGYLCYVPKARLTNEGRVLRKEAFEKGVSTGHNPSHPGLKATRVWQGFEQYLEDSSYTQPKIQLTPLGESLLGI